MRDHADRVIRWFAIRMAAVFTVSAAVVCLGLWGLWVVVHRWLG